MIVYQETEGYVVQAFDTETQEFISSKFVADGSCGHYIADDKKWPGDNDVPEKLVEMVQKYYFGYDMVQPSQPKRKKKTTTN